MPTATISRPTLLFAQLRMLRLYLASRPAARGVLQKTVGFGGASYISLSLSTPIRIGEKSSSTMAAQDDGAGEGRDKTQQSPLASQRGDGQAPGRIAKWFPLSASEGFSQWVSCGGCDCVWSAANVTTVGWPLPDGDRTPRALLHSLPAESAHTHPDGLRARIDIPLVR